MLMLAKTPFLRQRPVSGGAVPTFVAAGSSASVSSANDINVPYYAGLAANDIAFLYMGLFLTVTSTSQSFTATGWTQVDELAQAASGSLVGSQLLWKRLTGSESGTQAAHWGGVPGELTGVMFGIRGALASGTPYEGYGLNSGNTSTHISASITTTGPNRLGLRFGTDNSGNLYSPPSGWTELIDVSAAVSYRLDSKLIPAATTEPASSYAIGSVALWVAQTLAVIPA